MAVSASHDLDLFFRNPIFATFSAENREKLRSSITVREFFAGEVIVRAGSKFAFVGVLTSGMIISQRGKAEEGTLRLLLPMDMVGRPDRTRSSYELRVIANAKMCLLPVSCCITFLNQNPAAAIPFLSSTVGMIGQGREWIWIAYHREAFQKVCLFLCYIIHTYRRADLLSEGGPWVIPFPITRSEIGSFLGLGLHTVSRQLNTLKDQGVISYMIGRSLTILDLGALCQLAGMSGPSPLTSSWSERNFMTMVEF